MVRRVGLTPELIVDTAAEIADQNGLDGVTLAAVAARLGVRSPSLYSHIEGLPGVRRALAIQATRALAGAMHRARKGRQGATAFRALAHAYRRYASAHPGGYAATQQELPATQDAELYRALAEVVVPLMETLGEMGVAPAEMIHQTRAVRSALHGFVSLEGGRGFGMPVDFDQSFDRLVELLVSGIAAWPVQARRTAGPSIQG